MDLYADTILDHYRHPHKKLKIENGEWKIKHEEENLSCGDTIKIGLHIENDHIQDLAWEGEGCVISQAAMSLLSDQLIGKSMSDIDALTPNEITALLGVPISPRRMKCALLCLHTLKNTMHLYRDEPSQGWQETVGNEGETR